MNHLEKIANTVLDSCDSTNDLAKKLAESGYPHGTWVSARIQNAGRGRLGRKWDSLGGNLFLSIVIRNCEKNLWSWIPLTTAVAATQFLLKEFPSLLLQIKWPNDLYLNHSKVGGILCEGSLGGDASYVVVGLGMNCTGSPSELGSFATSLSTVCKEDLVSADRIRLGIIDAVMNKINHLASQGPDFIKGAYKSLSYFKPGDQISWGNEKHTAKVLGIAESGELEVIGLDGTCFRLYAEDVSRVRKANDESHP